METGPVPPYDLTVVTNAIAEAVDLGGRGTKARLARLLGVEPATVTKWVKGQSIPDRVRWSAIEDALDMPAGELARRATAKASDQGSPLDDLFYERVRAAMQEELAGIAGDLQVDSLLMVIGAAGWFFHWERGGEARWCARAWCRWSRGVPREAVERVMSVNSTKRPALRLVVLSAGLRARSDRWRRRPTSGRLTPGASSKRCARVATSRLRPSET